MVSWPRSRSSSMAPSLLVTTTEAALHPENETRMLSLNVDDSEEQTRRVLKKLAQTTGRNLGPDDSIHYIWQDFQRLLRIIGPKKVAGRSPSRSLTRLPISSRRGRPASGGTSRRSLPASKATL